MSPRRLAITGVALLVVAGAVVLRLVQVMVVDHRQWDDRARRQQEQVITVPGPRGDIVTSDGYLLATSVERVAIQVDTRLLSHVGLFAQAAAPLLATAPDELVRRLEHGPRAVWLAQQVPLETAERVRQLAPSALVLVPDAERIYPHGSLAAPVVGFVGREELSTVGRAGFEHHYDAMLSGEPETWIAFGDAVRRQLRLERVRRGRPGYDLELTLNARLQAAAEGALAEVIDRDRARGGSAVVLDARDGSILAAASLPSFDPNRPGATTPDHWRLRPVQSALEPGSTIKPLVAAAGLAAGAVAPGERFDCTHRGISVAGHWMRDHAEPGRYTLDEVIVHSANAGIIQLAERLEPQLLWRTLDAFGFGRRPDVGFPAEAAGLLPPVEHWSALSAAGLSLGQELVVSPLQLAVAYAAIANGGWMVRPRFVSRARSVEGTVVGVAERRSRVLDEALAAHLQAVLERTVEEGTGLEAQVPGYRVAGKTGTAQRAVAGGFDDEHHVSWFAGFLPMPAPWLVIVVAVENPQEDYWASTVAAPVFARIGAAAVGLLEIPPGPQPPAADVQRASAVRRTVTEGGAA